MERNYELVRRLNRSKQYLIDEEFEDWHYGKDSRDSYKEYSREIELYKRYKRERDGGIDYVGTGAKIISEGRDLSILIREDFLNLVSELFDIDGYTVYLPKKVQNQGINMLLERSTTFIGNIRCIVITRKLFFDNKIGIRTLRELDYLINQGNSSKGIIVTTSNLTKGALKFAEDRSNRIFYLDKEKLSRRILQGNNL